MGSDGQLVMRQHVVKSLRSKGGVGDVLYLGDVVRENSSSN